MSELDCIFGRGTVWSVESAEFLTSPETWPYPLPFHHDKPKEPQAFEVVGNSNHWHPNWSVFLDWQRLELDASTCTKKGTWRKPRSLTFWGWSWKASKVLCPNLPALALKKILPPSQLEWLSSIHFANDWILQLQGVLLQPCYNPWRICERLWGGSSGLIEADFDDLTASTEAFSSTWMGDKANKVADSTNPGKNIRRSQRSDKPNDFPASTASCFFFQVHCEAFDQELSTYWAWQKVGLHHFHAKQKRRGSNTLGS